MRASVQAAAPPRPQAAVPGFGVWAAGAAIAAGVGAAAGIAPFAILATVLVVACGAGVLHSPLVFLWIITAISGVGLGWTDTAALDIGGRSINVNGLRWVMVMATCVVVLVRLPGAAPVPRPLRGWLGFVLLAAVGTLWAPQRFEAVKQMLLYAGPLLTALVVMGTVQRPKDVVLLRSALYVAAAIAAIVGLVPALAGEVLGGSFDPEGRLLHRAFGTFLLPIMALSLARLRYGDVRQGIAAVVLFGLTLATLSRVTIAAMVGLAVLSMGGTSLRLRATLASVVLIFVVAVNLYDPLGERIFADERRGFTPTIEISGSGANAQLHIGGLQLSGRGLVWMQTYTHAIEEPVFGHGTGSATTFLAERTDGHTLFPHNEYLRVFHDLGVAGLTLLLAAFAMVLLGFRRLRRNAATRITRELAFAALLCWIALALISVFDNALGYFVFFTHNVFLLSALAVRSAQLEADA